MQHVLAAYCAYFFCVVCRAVQHKQAAVLGQIDELRERLTDLNFEQQQQRDEVAKLNSKIYALTNYVERSRRVQKRVRVRLLVCRSAV